MRRMGGFDLLLKVKSFNKISQYVNEYKIGGKYKSKCLKSKVNRNSEGKIINPKNKYVNYIGKFNIFKGAQRFLFEKSIDLSFSWVFLARHR